MQLIVYSTQSNDLAAPLKCRQIHVQREHQRQCSFQLPLKTKVLARFTTLSTYQLQGRNSECETASQWKTRFVRNPTFLTSFSKTQCADMQLIEYSAQSNDLAAPLKCRQLLVHREHQRQCSSLLPLKTKVLAPFTTLSTYQLQGRNSECETASQWITRFERKPSFLTQRL